MKSLLLSVFCLLSATATLAQTGRCIISTSDSTAFALTVNGISWGDSAQTTWDFVGEPGNYRITAFPDDSLASFLQSEVVVTQGIERSYDLSFLADGQFMMYVASETSILEETPLDAGTSAVAVASTQRAALSGVTGSAFDQTLVELRAIFFQKDRIALIESFLLEHSLSVEQLRQLLSSIDAEDARLRMALLAVEKLYQPSRVGELEDLFYLSASKRSLSQAAH